MPLLIQLILLLLCCMTTAGCSNRPAADEEQCLYCHQGIEHTSSSHSGCISCHGGNPKSRVKDKAHQGIYGLSNRSYPGRWEMGCGPCHRHQLERMQSSQMFTAAGMIAQTQATWEGEQPERIYATRPANGYDQRGNAIQFTSVTELDTMAGEIYRKGCARCHVAFDHAKQDGDGHPAGCAACHFPYGNRAIYWGADQTVRGSWPHSATHTMHTLPTLQSCAQCHHRSGRTALSYQGLYDGNNSLVPTRNGQPGPTKGSDNRNFTSIAPDIHYIAGMDCIDCHTSREIMGEGYTAASLHGQLEVRCENCHGSPNKPPVYRVILRENEDPVRESRSYRLQMRPGMQMIQTSKGRSFSNVFHVDGNVLVQLKNSGKLLRAQVITGTPEHTVAGHDRLSCMACHSRTVVQCYGCHTEYDKQDYRFDFIKGQATKGHSSETEDYRTLYPFPLALNSSGAITPVTPGCQTFVTVLDEQGKTVMDEHVMHYKGKRQLRFAPFFGHNTGKRAVGCSECHANPVFLGFGQHVVEGRSIKGTLICEYSDNKPLDGYLTMKNGIVQAYSAITRANSRPLNQQEVQRALAVNTCLVCHPSAKDPIYRKRINYRDLDDSLHRRLLAPH